MGVVCTKVLLNKSQTLLKAVMYIKYIISYKLIHSTNEAWPSCASLIEKVKDHINFTHALSTRSNLIDRAPSTAFNSTFPPA